MSDSSPNPWPAPAPGTDVLGTRRSSHPHGLPTEPPRTTPAEHDLTTNPDTIPAAQNEPNRTASGSQPTQRTTRQKLVGIATIFVVTAIGGLSGYIGGYIGGYNAAVENRTSTPATEQAPVVRPVVDGNGVNAAVVYAAAAPSVVQVIAGENGSQGAGTGIIWDDNGSIVTNAHVLGEATDVRVRLPDQNRTVPVDIVGIDPARDLALLHLPDTPDNLVVAERRTRDVAVGEPALAIGYALALSGGATLTQGIVSATDRTIGELAGLFQIDAAISPGNSGGPIVDGEGNVIGIATVKVTAAVGADNVGFAIPVTTAAAVVDQLRSGENDPRGFLGVSTAPPTLGELGAVIIDVVDDSPAARAGLEVGDVVIHVDGQQVVDPGDLALRIQMFEPGASVTINVLRDDEETTVTATLATREP